LDVMNVRMTLIESGVLQPGRTDGTIDEGHARERSSDMVSWMT